MSCFVLVKWAIPVKRNIAANAKHAEARQLANADTPRTPMPRNSNQDPNNTHKTIIESSPKYFR